MRDFCAACSASIFLCSLRSGFGDFCKRIHSSANLLASSRMAESTEASSPIFRHREANTGAGVASSSSLVGIGSAYQG